MKALTVSIQDSTYQGLKKMTGRRQVSRFIDQLIKAELERKNQALAEAYKSFAASKAMKKEDKLRAGAAGDGIK
jgi:predicted CopG family antitoxin